MYKWSLTQSLNFTEQLKAGVRYFDFRVASRKQSDKIYFIHGLYGMTVEDGVNEIMSFLRNHKKEVVMLDFNHFYEMSHEQHLQLLKTLAEIIGDMLCLYIGTESLTLNILWEQGVQVVVIYHHPVCSLVMNFTCTLRIGNFSLQDIIVFLKVRTPRVKCRLTKNGFDSKICKKKSDVNKLGAVIQ